MATNTTKKATASTKTVAKSKATAKPKTASKPKTVTKAEPKKVTSKKADSIWSTEVSVIVAMAVEALLLLFAYLIITA